VDPRPRCWSWDALRHARLTRKPWPDLVLGSERLVLLLPYKHPVHGLGHLAVSSPTRDDAGRWMYGRPANPGKEQRVAGQALAVLARSADAETAGTGTEKGVVRADRAALTRLLQLGLHWRSGAYLNGSEEHVFVHLIARGASLGGLRPCELCAIVFSAPRAHRCPACRRRPAPRVQPWHIALAPGDDHRAVYYWLRCQAPGCGQEVRTWDPRQRYCEDHRDGAGRVRRCRGSLALHGRRLFRFNAGDLSGLSFVLGPSGHSADLRAEGGVIETPSAELALQLERRFGLRRLD
jgi:hypothetical protein